MPPSSRGIGCVSCVLQVKLKPKNLSEDEDQLDTTQSCSGFVIDAKNGFILTSGGLFSQLLSAADIQLPLTEHQTPEEGDIQVFWEQVMPHSETPKLRSCGGRLLGVWSCYNLAESLTNIFKGGDGWSFQGDLQDGEESDTCGSEGSRLGVSKTKRESHYDDITWLSSFALVKADEVMCGESSSPMFGILPTTGLYPGSPVAVFGTPFGSLCPSALVNSYTGGVVTNVTGKRNAVILTDARCLPGTEGAAVFSEPQQNRKPQVIGLVVAPMCFKTNQWVGLSVACSISEILQSMYAQLHYTKDYLNQIRFQEGSAGHTLDCHNFLDSVRLVKVGSSWGSGVIVGSKHKLLLTCRHVVRDAITNNRSVSVRVDRKNNSWCRAKVIFATSLESMIDFAVIQLTNHYDHLGPLIEIPIAANTYEGEPLFAVGFPLFGPETCLGASVTSGHVSKVIRYKGQAVMLQTSCGVHPGSSGGALVSQTTGKLVGIMANNCRDDTNKVTIPHLNFSIPASIFLKPLRRYLHTNDVQYLKVMNIHDKAVESLWKLQNTPTRGHKPPTKVICKL